MVVQLILEQICSYRDVTKMGDIIDAVFIDRMELGGDFSTIYPGKI